MVMGGSIGGRRLMLMLMLAAKGVVALCAGVRVVRHAERGQWAGHDGVLEMRVLMLMLLMLMLMLMQMLMLMLMQMRMVVLLAARGLIWVVLLVDRSRVKKGGAYS